MIVPVVPIKVVLITVWEDADSTRVRTGISSYSRSLVKYMMQIVKKLQLPLDLVVIAQEDRDQDQEHPRIVKGLSYESPIKTMHRLVRALLHEQPHVVHLQFAYHLYGTVRNLIAIVLALTLVKLLRRVKIVITMHEVLPMKYLKNIEKMSRLKGTYVKILLRLLPLHVFHRIVLALLNILADRFIIHEKFQLNVLTREYGIDIGKIVHVGHGVEYREDLWGKVLQLDPTVGKGTARIVVFGFLAPYKGLRLLPKIVNSEVRQSSELVIAGGVHPRLFRDLNYRRWLTETLRVLKQNFRNMTWLRYVPNSEMPHVFENATLVLTLHETCFGASGPEALALSYARPVVSACVEDGDVRKVQWLSRVITLLLSNPDFYRSWLLKLRDIARRRSWERVALQHLYTYLSLLAGK